MQKLEEVGSLFPKNRLQTKFGNISRMNTTCSFRDDEPDTAVAEALTNH